MLLRLQSRKPGTHGFFCSKVERHSLENGNYNTDVVSQGVPVLPDINPGITVLTGGSLVRAEIWDPFYAL